jgi:tRNA(fMet)-specific endonuclease VapC
MLILDTDHLSEFIRSSAAGLRLREKLAATPVAATISIVSMEEANRGRLANLKKARTAATRLAAYHALSELTAALEHWDVVAWTTASEAAFARLVSARPRIGTMDLRIAAVAIANDATLLSRNLRKFERVVGLKVENWLD